MTSYLSNSATSRYDIIPLSNTLTNRWSLSTAHACTSSANIVLSIDYGQLMHGKLCYRAFVSSEERDK